MAAHRAGADAVGLVDVGCSAGFNLHADRVGIIYSNGQVLGEASSPVMVSCSVVGDRAVPAHALPEVVTRTGVDRDPLDVADAEDVRWMRAGLPADRPEESAWLEAEMALAATVPRELLRGDPVELLPDALARVAAGVLPVVTTTWSLARLPLERRSAFLDRLEEAAADRTVAWVSVEGVGVAPTVPTLGDRLASGHSILGLAILDGAGRRTEAIGRCWSRGRFLAWLAAT
jgi:hypothetical protein